MNLKLTKKSKPLILTIVSVSLFFILTIGFSANAITSQLTDLWNLSQFDLALLSMILIIGFVIGGLIYSISNLPDLIETQKFYCFNAFFGALSNLLAAFSFNSALVLQSRENLKCWNYKLNFSKIRIEYINKKSD